MFGNGDQPTGRCWAAISAFTHSNIAMPFRSRYLCSEYGPASSGGCGLGLAHYRPVDKQFDTWKRKMGQLHRHGWKKCEDGSSNAAVQ
jgi:hypothetical protein